MATEPSTGGLQVSRVKDPEEKKRISLSRDHRTLALEGNKSFRSAWPLKKARANRRFRRDAIQALSGAIEADADETPIEATAKPVRSLKKYGVMSLDQSIAIKDDDHGMRWNMNILGKNPDALSADISTKRRPRQK